MRCECPPSDSVGPSCANALCPRCGCHQRAGSERGHALPWQVPQPSLRVDGRLPERVLRLGSVLPAWLRQAAMQWHFDGLRGLQVRQEPSRRSLWKAHLCTPHAAASRAPQRMPGISALRTQIMLLRRSRLRAHVCGPPSLSCRCCTRTLSPAAAKAIALKGTAYSPPPMMPPLPPLFHHGLVATPRGSC